MSRLVRVVVAGLAPLLACVSPLPTAPVGAETADASARITYLDPAHLPVGAKPQRAWLAGLHLTTKQGIGFDLPFPKADAKRLTLLGNSPRGFVVLRETPLDDYHDRFDVFTVTQHGHGSTAHRFFRQTINPTTNASQVRLSHDGLRIVVETFDRGTGVRIRVVQVSGKQVVSREFQSTGVLDFSGPRLVLGDYGESAAVVDWTLGHAPVRRPTDQPPSDADIAHDVLFATVDIDDDQSGPTSLSAPGVPPWSQVDVSSWRVSPNGSQALAISAFSVDVTAMSDGSTVSSIDVRDRAHFIAWESPTAYLLIARGPSGSAVVRCQATTGACRRTTPLTTQPLSMSIS